MVINVLEKENTKTLLNILVNVMFLLKNGVCQEILTLH